MKPTVEERNTINAVYASKGGDGCNDQDLVHVSIFSQGKAIANAMRDGASSPSVTFGIIANNQINAVATLHPEYGYIVGIYCGMIQKICQSSRLLYPPTNDNSTPVGEYWFALAQVAISFIVEHECAHVLNGHLSLQTMRAKQMDMFASHDDKCSTSLTKLDLQTLEMDADACAVTRVLLWAIQIYKASKSGLRISDLIRPIFVGKSELEIVFDVARAITLAIVSLQETEPEIENCKIHSHLPRTARIFHALGLFDSIARSFPAHGIEDAIKNPKFADIAVEVLDGTGSTVPLNGEILTQYLIPQTGYIHTLTKNWREVLEPKIATLSYCPTSR